MKICEGILTFLESEHKPGNLGQQDYKILEILEHLFLLEAVRMCGESIKL